MASPARLLIAIVNYRTPELTLACLRSLAPEVAAVAGVRVIVVDNASGDGSLEKLEAAIRDAGWSSWLELLPSSRNLGFAGGNNLAIARGEPAEYVLLLNSDTIVHGGCLRRCLEVMESDPRIGAMSCRVLNADGSIQNVARKLPTPLLATAAALRLPWHRVASARDVGWLGGAFLFVRASVFGGRVRLDDDFFFYGEDVEFCHRIHRRGFSLRYDPVASIVHLGGGSSDPTRLPSALQSAQQWRARYLVQQKCWGRPAALWLRAVDLLVAALELALAARPGAGARRAELRARMAMILRAGGAA
jgi:N-acetylglucosaminyl-diphospho-decaprenol L-rhamnosyltransferase